ncbi:MAG TPA: hypothetical protein VMD78_11145 [Candidatus Baltobacteraceae bacterium]|nr:hypothetical protein [Candidatus Baltobacteraceae bacterium]
MEKHELSRVESQIQSVRTAHSVLAGTSDLDELFNIIHRPGWTTPAEVAFLTTALESISAQTNQLLALRQGILTAAKLVNASRSAGV